jgi:hypothetical protein
MCVEIIMGIVLGALIGGSLSGYSLFYLYRDYKKK